MTLLVIIFVLLTVNGAHAQWAGFIAAANLNFLLDGSGGMLTDGSGAGLIAA